MAIRTLRDTGPEFPIPNHIDGAVYGLICEDCVIGGKGNDFELNYSANSFSVSFAQGCQALLNGNSLWLETDISIVLPSNAVSYLCARIDPSMSNGQTGSIVALSQSAMKSQDVNNGGTRDLLLYIVTTSGSGVTKVEDMRNIRNGASGNIITKVLKRGETTITFKDSKITDKAAFSFYTSIYGPVPIKVTPPKNESITLTFPVQDVDMVVGIKVDGVLS